MSQPAAAPPQDSDPDQETEPAADRDESKPHKKLVTAKAGAPIDVEKILRGAQKSKRQEYVDYARERYGRASNIKGGNTDRYRELLYGGYDHIEALKVFRHFVVYLKPYKALIALSALGFMALSALQSSRSLIMKFIIDGVLPGGAANTGLLIMVCGALLGLFLIQSGVQLMCRYLIVYIGSYSVYDVRKKVFDHMQNLHIGFFEQEISGKLVTRLINDVQSIQNLISTGLNVLILALFTFIINLTIMFILSWRLTLFSLFIIPLYWWVVEHYKMRLYEKSMEVRERHSIMAGNVTEVVLGAKVVKGFAMEDEEARRFNNMLSDNLVPEMDLGVYNANRGILLQMITAAGFVSVYLFGGLMILRGGEAAISLGTFAAFTGLLFQMYNAMTEMSNLRLQVILAQTGLERVLAVLHVDPEVKSRPNAVVLSDVKGRVEFKDVHFSYDGQHEVVRGVSLTAEPGQMVALVGPSGSGKTTIASLLARFYEIDSGAILLDGRDIRDIDLMSYRSQFGIVLQDPFLFSGSIEDNIRYGKPDATQEEVLWAAEQANAMEFIKTLPEGIDTLVGERGGLLSGGQRQRISIARALIKRPKLLILDEATSSLDNESERLVQEAMDRLMAGRTVFVIAHRLTTVQNADQIVVMSKGKVVEVGPHEDLMRRNGLYSRLYRGAQIQVVRKQREKERSEAAPKGLSE